MTINKFESVLSNSLNRQLYMLTITQSVIFITPLARLYLQTICSQKMSIFLFLNAIFSENMLACGLW